MKKHINTLMAFCMACCVLCNAVLAHPRNAVENHDSTHEAYVEASRAIIGIEWNEEDSRLFFAEKPDYEEIKAAFPKALDVFLGDGSKASIPVSWETQDDYLESDAAEYVFYPYSSGYEFTILWRLEAETLNCWEPPPGRLVILKSGNALIRFMAFWEVSSSTKEMSAAVWIVEPRQAVTEVEA